MVLLKIHGLWLATEPLRWMRDPSLYISPKTALSTEDFPEPKPPMKAMNSPFFTVRFRFLILKQTPS